MLREIAGQSGTRQRTSSGSGRQTPVGLNTEGNGRADNTTHGEHGPEERERAALVLLLGISHHDGALRCPEETGAHAENGRSGDNKGAVAMDLEGPERTGVQRVTQGADAESQASTEDVL